MLPTSARRAWPERAAFALRALRSLLPLLAPLALLAACARGARAPTGAAPRRVGLLVYDVQRVVVRRALAGLETGVEIAPAGRVFAVVTLRRANATQSDARATEGGIQYIAPGGAAYSPYRVKPLACHGGADECALLDPGGARTDELVYALPDVPAAREGARLRVTAAPAEPGPRATEFGLVFTPD